MGHDAYMGSAGKNTRKGKHPLAKVPKYEEPNEIQFPGLAGSGGEAFPSRYGHAEAAKGHRPGRFGTFMLKCLGLKPGEHKK
jgi:hypothetical protein